MWLGWNGNGMGKGECGGLKMPKVKSKNIKRSGNPRPILSEERGICCTNEFEILYGP